MQSIEGNAVEFFFYRESCEDLIFKRGKIRKQVFIGYVIQARFDEQLLPHMKHFNNMKFFFNSRDFVMDDEDALLRKLLGIYISLFKTEIKK